MLARLGYRHSELKAVVSGRIRMQMFSLGAQGVWARASWSCGCVAEGPDIDDLLLLERCAEHGTLRLPDRAAIEASA